MERWSRKRLEDAGLEDWNDMARNRGTPVATRNWMRLGMHLFPELPEGAWTYQHPDFGLGP